jgi:hypothetical protein
MNIPATFGPICFSGSLEDWNVYGQTTDDGRQVIAIVHLKMNLFDLDLEGQGHSDLNFRCDSLACPNIYMYV